MIVAGSGHRPEKVGGYSKEAQEVLVKIARDWLVRHNVSRVITGMALGWDQALAQAAQRLAIPFVAAIPFKGQESAWPKESQALYHRILEDAYDIVYVSEGGYAPWKMQDRNKWMVDNADAVVALWDGSDGGTGNCLRYAAKKLCPIYNLWEKYIEAQR